MEKHQNPSLNVEGHREGDPFQVQIDEAKKTAHDLDQYIERSQRLLDSHKRLFTTFARDISLSFRMSDRFMIDYKTGEVYLGATWFADKNFTEGQFIWAGLHELGHFVDMSQDPKAVLDKFKRLRESAKATGETILAKWKEKFGQSHPEFIEQISRQEPIDPHDPSAGTMSRVDQAAYQMHHSFYNSLEDIYDNNLVARKAPRYEDSDEGGKEVANLYRTKLFRKTDYRKQPRHMQFMNALLREEMVKDEKVEIDDDVKAALEQPIMFQGKEYTAKDIVERFLKPRTGRDTKPGTRHMVVRETLEPIFLDLLANDLDEWDPEEPQQQQGGGQESQDKDDKDKEKNPSDKGNQGQEQGDPDQSDSDIKPDQDGGNPANPFGKEYKEIKKNNPDQISEKDIKKWIQNYQEEKDKEEERQAQETKEANQTAEDKARQAEIEMENQWAREHQIPPDVMERYREVVAVTAPYREELSRLWQGIIYGSSRGLNVGIEGHYKTGDLDVPKVIDEWPKVETGRLDQVRAMKKMVIKEALIQRPDLIRVRLVGDLSGSMNIEKRKVLEQAFVLIMLSLRDFRAFLNMTRGQTKAKLDVDTEAWVFGDYAKKVKSFQSEVGLNDEQVEIIRVFSKLQEDLRNTYDNKALAAIKESLTQQEKDKIQKKKIMEIVFEITDGGSSAAHEARTQVDTLDATGVITRAFQIGKVDDTEKELFNFVWNDKRPGALGQAVGPDIAKLLPAITEALKNYLQGVRL